MSKILLIDAYSQIYRVFYAIRQLTNAKGEPANALFGMARLFLQLDETMPTEYGAIAFDHGKCTRRVALLPQYKAQRPPMPPELRSQTEAIREWARAFGWKLVQRDGFEADDLICGMTGQRNENSVLILSSDKDLSQLVSPQVHILQHGTPKQPWIEADEAAVQAKFGVSPAQLGDYLALLGDSSDNIPGIEGCGPKTAAKLLADFGTIDNLRTHLAELKNEKLRNTLAASAQHLDENRSLVHLDPALPEDWNGLGSIKRTPPDWTRLAELATAQGFHAILEAIRKRSNTQPMLF